MSELRGAVRVRREKERAKLSMFTSLEYKHRRASLPGERHALRARTPRPRTSRLGAGRKVDIDSAARSVLPQALKGLVRIWFSHMALPSSTFCLIHAQQARKLKKKRLQSGKEKKISRRNTGLEQPCFYTTRGTSHPQYYTAGMKLPLALITGTALH